MSEITQELNQAHQVNKATLESIQSSQPPPPNPLLQRNKLKSSRKPKPKSKSKSGTAALVDTVNQTKNAELNVISAGIGYSDSGVAGGEEGEVLDLADQLLEQLDARLADEQDSSEDDGEQSSGLLIPKASGSASATEYGAGGGSGGLREKMHDIKTGLQDKLSGDSGEKKVSRQQARKLRKSNHHDFLRTTAHAEVAAENDHSVEDEKRAIDVGCTKLGVRIKEIDPDGHCLYSAIADQANVLGLTLTNRKESHTSTRYYAAQYMRTHRDEFLPFLTSGLNNGDGIMTEDEYEAYCDTVEKTAEWGGQLEINALSKYFNAPIWVLQAGTDVVKIGDNQPGRGPMLISYHRKMYGLGEHYNSLRNL